MADPTLSQTLDHFEAKVQKGRLIAIPAESQRKLGLSRQQNNHLLRFSLRKAGKGRWNNLYARLTFDNEFAIPTNVPGIQPGNIVEIKVREVLATAPVRPRRSQGAALLVRMADDSVADDRSIGADRHDEYLNEEASRGAVPRTGDDDE